MNIHAITVYPLQNRLLVIEYSDSSVAATLHSSADIKTTTHIPTVLTAIKALTQLRKVQLYTWVPPSTCLDSHFPFLTVLGCAKKISLITFGTDYVFCVLCDVGPKKELMIQIYN